MSHQVPEQQGVVDLRNSPKLARHVAALAVVSRAIIELIHRVDLRIPVGVLLDEPDIAGFQQTRRRIAQQRDVMGREDQLRPQDIQMFILEKPNNVTRQIWVKARIQLVNEKHRAIPERLEGMPRRRQPGDRAGTLQLGRFQRKNAAAYDGYGAEYAADSEEISVLLIL